MAFLNINKKALAGSSMRYLSPAASFDIPLSSVLSMNTNTDKHLGNALLFLHSGN